MTIDLKSMFPPLPNDDMLEVADFLVEDLAFDRDTAMKVATRAKDVVHKVIKIITDEEHHFNDAEIDAVAVSMILGSMDRWLGPNCQAMAIGTLKLVAMMRFVRGK